jgi:hypothetical protein
VGKLLFIESEGTPRREMRNVNHEQEIVDLGSRFGNEAAEHIAKRAEAYCEYERERIELSNQPRIMELHFEGKHLATRERELPERLQRTAPPLALPSRRRRARYYWAVGIILTLAAFFFSLIAFRPYRLGWIGILYCAGIAIITPVAVEEFLEAWKSEGAFKLIVTAVFCAAILGGALLAAIRGDLLAEEVDQSHQAVVIENGPAPSTPEPQNTFYESTRHSLRWLMLLFALAIDLGAGIAVHRARTLGANSGEDYEVIFKELQEVRQRLGEVVYEIAGLTNAPAAFVARFWRDFYRAMLTQTVRSALTKLLMVPLCLALAISVRSQPQARLNFVVEIDLSASEAAKGPDGKTSFSRDVDGVAHLLASIPAGASMTVIGITANSFAQPYILLRADVTDDPGYFGERLTSARNQLVRAWQRRAAALTPTARGTDVLGGLFTASELFRAGSAGARNELFLFSDMRHVTRELNLEAPGILHVDALMAVARARSLIANLNGVTVYVLGANAREKQSMGEWNALKQFWSAYFAKAGANLPEYSVGSEPPTAIRSFEPRTTPHGQRP